MTMLRYGPAISSVAALALASHAIGMGVSVSTDFPGGNIRVIGNRGDTVELAPDLRDSPRWFYWQFDALADRTGSVRFVFAEPPQIGAAGPAVSCDGGKSWRWLGTGPVRYAVARGEGGPDVTTDSFDFEFTNASRKVRFCVAIPYLQRDLGDFLAGQKANPHLGVEVLTKTRKGRPVALLRIGNPGPGVQAVLVTARHHACESMASYVLEGFMREALSDSPAGADFRSRYVLYAVPIVDADGVEAGDQGKGRMPHDHNRDYGPTNLYPEIRAIQALAREKKIELALDFHCPTLRGEIGGAFYFDGLAIPPTDANVRELTAWMADEVPQALARGPLVWLKSPPASMPVDGLPFSRYFAVQERVRMAATLEVPYALADGAYDAAMARAYGAALLRAWTRTGFPAEGETRAAGHDAFEEMQKTLLALTKSNPGEAERLANECLNDAHAPELYRIEARLQLGSLHARHKRYPDALREFDSVSTNSAATARQRDAALAERVVVACSDPASAAGTAERALADFLRIPYPGRAQKGRVHGAACGFFEKSGRLDLALEHVREQLACVVPHEKGRTLNRMAALHDAKREPEKAIECRKQAVELLRRQLNPVPVGIFGPQMAADLFDALSGIPTSTEKERQDAANMVLNHPLKIVELIKRVSPQTPGAGK